MKSPEELWKEHATDGWSGDALAIGHDEFIAILTSNRLDCNSMKTTDGIRHDWEFFADQTAKCRKCGLHVPSASAPFHLHNCKPKSQPPSVEPKMTCDEDSLGSPEECE